MSEFDIREQIVRIDNLLVDAQKKQRERHLTHWQVGFTVLAGGLAAGVLGGAAVTLVPSILRCWSVR